MTNAASLKEFMVKINIQIDKINIRAVDAISESYVRYYVTVYII